MPPLKQLQQQFKAYILQGLPGIEALVALPTRDSVKTRLDIYADAYLLRLLETLELYYEQLKKIMGEPAFEKLSREYVEKYPSHHPAMEVLGADLARFIAEHPGYQEQPYLAEWAQFEWTLQQAALAAEIRCLDPQILATVAQDEWPFLSWQFHPRLATLNNHWNLIAVWSAIIENKKLPAWEENESTLMVWCRDFQVYYKLLQPSEALMLATLQAGGNFSTAYESLLPVLPEEEIAVFMIQTLQEWLTLGLIVKCQTK